VNDLVALADAGVAVRAAAHITGGGLPENLPRSLPDGCGALIDASRWERGAVFERILESGRVDEDDAWRTFNMGIGMCVIVPPDAVDAARAVAGDARVIGRVESGPEGVRFGGL
jgi:phosphoribosylformylglycinamidine cyclo-ligase